MSNAPIRRMTLSMKRRFARLGSSEGFTLVELVLTVTILLILLEIIGASYETVKARMRSTQARADMTGIADAGQLDYTNTSMWAAPAFGFLPPEFLTGKVLAVWPRAPCPGWYYCWENWNSAPVNAVRVTLRNASNAAVWDYCVDTHGGTDCQAADVMVGFGGTPIEISADPKHYLWCSE